MSETWTFFDRTNLGLIKKQKLSYWVLSTITVKKKNITEEAIVATSSKSVKFNISKHFFHLLSIASVFTVHCNKPTVPVWESESFSSWCPAL